MKKHNKLIAVCTALVLSFALCSCASSAANNSAVSDNASNSNTSSNSEINADNLTDTVEIGGFAMLVDPSWQPRDVNGLVAYDGKDIGGITVHLPGMRVITGNLYSLSQFDGSFWPTADLRESKETWQDDCATYDFGTIKDDGRYYLFVTIPDAGGVRITFSKVIPEDVVLKVCKTATVDKAKFLEFSESQAREIAEAAERHAASEAANASNTNVNSNVGVTTGQKNALKKAKSYLSYTSFSYSGLLNQLVFEGFTQDEATYGVDNCGADWSLQAVYKAKSYLEYSSFSRSGLVEQLVFEGFTQEQAEYGVSVALN